MYKAAQVWKWPITPDKKKKEKKKRFVVSLKACVSKSLMCEWAEMRLGAPWPWCTSHILWPFHKLKLIVTSPHWFRQCCLATSPKGMKNPCFTAGEDFHGNNTNPSRQDGNSGAVWNDRGWMDLQYYLSLRKPMIDIRQ